jgi:hypothetical protein
MWRLHKILERDEQPETYLIEEASRMMSSIDTEDFKEVLELTHSPAPKTPAQAALYFIEGLKNSEFFAFKEFITGLNGHR